MTRTIYLVTERPDKLPNNSYPFIITDGNLEVGLAKAILDAHKEGRGDVKCFYVEILELKA